MTNAYTPLTTPCSEMSESGEPVRVLLVDDEPGFAEMVAQFLERADERVEVTTAAGGTEGLDRLEGMEFDGIVADYDMPGLDGIELLETVRATRPQVPFLLYTGKGSERVAGEAISAGVTDYVEKDVGAEGYERLADRLRTAVDRYRARRRETAAHERARTILNTSPDAILVAVAGELVYANPAAGELFGADEADELADLAFADLVAPGETEEAVAALRPAAEDGETARRFRLTVHTLDGEPVPVELTIRRITWEGDPGVVAVLHDVTSQRERERELRAERDVLRRVYETISARDVDFETKIEELLDLGTEVLDLPYGFLSRIEDGTQRIEAAVGDHDLLRPGEECPLSEAYCRKTLTQDDAVTIHNAVVSGWEDDPAYDRFELGAYVGSKVVFGGEIYGTFCFAATEPREAEFTEFERTFVDLLARWASYELENRAANAELRRQNERLEEFASMVSHDLRNPITVASGYLELAREEGEPEQFDRIEGALDRMERLVEDLLYLAREGEDLDEVTAVALGEVAETAWAAVDDPEDGATLRAEGLGTVTADPDRLRQLLQNLFANATEYGGPDVTVAVESIEGGFAVVDDGPGIPEELHERVFERGYTTDAEGSGFGLYIAEEIADAHGWELSLSRGEDGGARFEVTGVESGG